VARKRKTEHEYRKAGGYAKWGVAHGGGLRENLADTLGVLDNRASTDTKVFVGNNQENRAPEAQDNAA